MNTVEKSARTSGNVTNLDEVRQAKARALEDNASSDVATVEKSTKSSDEHGNRRFDAEKVARIKAAIAAGEYQIDSSRIADRFIEHDRNQ